MAKRVWDETVLDTPRWTKVVLIAETAKSDVDALVYVEDELPGRYIMRPLRDRLGRGFTREWWLDNATSAMLLKMKFG